MDKSQLLKNIEEMELKLAYMKKELAEEKHFPQKGDDYFCVDIYGEIDKQKASDNNGRFKVFRTEEDAKKFYKVECARQRVKDEIKRLNDGWTPDWKNNNEIKNMVKLYKDELVADSFKYTKILDNAMYLRSIGLVGKLIKTHKQDLLLILGQ